MIHSMTGYGEAQCVDDDVSYVLELRSLNHRYFKAQIKLPEHLQNFETEIDRLVRGRLRRGSVTYNLRVRDTSAEAAYEINTAALQSYLSQLPDSGQASSMIRVDLAAVLQLPGVCQPPEIDESRRERQWRNIERLTVEAIDRLIAMRAAEGSALREDLLGHCRSIQAHLDVIRERAPVVIEEYFKRLRQRANTLLTEAQVQLEKDDLAREVALFAERCDVSEELARFGSHLEQFEELSNGRDHAGRKLDFLCQELLREANTIASKSNDVSIAREVVEIKALIDRLKEQVQNVQ